MAITVHVLHLVDGWQRALQEARRVLRKPGGWLLIARDAPADTGTPSATRLVNAQWSAILNELGTSRDLLLPGIKESNRTRSDASLVAYLRELGAQTQTVTLAEHETPPLSPRAMAQRYIDRLYSSDWQLSDELHAEAVRRLQTWLDSECGEPDRPISGIAQFKAITAHW